MNKPLAFGLAALGLLASSAVLANSTGLPGRAKIGCTGGGCHDGGNAPTLTFDAPATVAPGETIDLMVMVEGPQESNMPKAGINIEAGAGTLLADESGTLKPLLQQLVQASPVPFDVDSGMVHFMFQWTAPDELGPVTLYASANSVNGDFAITGDMSALIEKTITVAEGGAGGGGGSGGEPGAGGDQPGGSVSGADAGTDDGGDGGGGGCQVQPGRAPLSGFGAAFGGLALLALRRRIRRG